VIDLRLAPMSLGFIARASQHSTWAFPITRCREKIDTHAEDAVAVEAPLEIRIATPSLVEQTLAITMRTPGADDELTAGYLFSEGVIKRATDLSALEHSSPPAGADHQHNVIRAQLSIEPAVAIETLARSTYTSSSCGLCGKTNIDSVMASGGADIGSRLSVSLGAVLQLPERMRSHQSLFDASGGVHGAAVFDVSGQIRGIREDIGRHNALDKLIGAHVLRGFDRSLEVSAGQGVLLSGRASFELIQKAAVFGAEMVVAVGPPSSLACELADACGMTLVGFTNDAGANIYTHAQRVQRD
tara:strand:- start:649 stop:1548 length:900 start_codon:yes stop_codon:yes gene_type:complete